MCARSSAGKEARTTKRRALAYIGIYSEGGVVKERERK